MVSREEIAAVAGHARLDLTDDEVDALRDDLDDILDSFASLDAIDTEGVEPALHPVPGTGEPRDDVPEDCLDPEEVFANTDNEEDGFFVGPRAVQDD